LHSQQLSGRATSAFSSGDGVIFAALPRIGGLIKSCCSCPRVTRRLGLSSTGAAAFPLPFTRPPEVVCFGSASCDTFPRVFTLAVKTNSWLRVTRRGLDSSLRSPRCDWMIPSFCADKSSWLHDERLSFDGSGDPEEESLPPEPLAFLKPALAVSLVESFPDCSKSSEVGEARLCLPTKAVRAHTIHVTESDTSSACMMGDRQAASSADVKWRVNLHQQNHTEQIRAGSKHAGKGMRRNACHKSSQMRI
jgi:hypothetical protein